MKKWIAFILFVTVHLGVAHENHKVILLLLDGFRYDYFTEELAGFRRLIENGVKADRLIPAFPSVSFTNYYSIATGLYPESNGMIGNFMFDPEHDKEFVIGTQESDFDSLWWDGGEPIWISSEKGNKKAMMFFWLGCQSIIRGMKPTVCYKFTGIMPSFKNLTFAINESIEGFASDQFQFSGIYYGLMDKNGHAYGPGSPEVMQDVRDVDGEINRLLDLLETTDAANASGKLINTVSLIIVSDHGMASVGPNQHIILSEIIDKNDLERTLRPDGADVTMQLWPKAGKGEAIYEALSKTEGLTPYWKEELPTRWHFANNPRVPPLTVVADNHFVILSPAHEGDPSEFNWNLGMHGYDNAFLDVSGIFLATGPAFKSGVKTDGLENIEIYQIMCHILEILAGPHNGTWSNVENMLNDDFNAATHIQATTLVSCVTFSIFYVFC